jgi:protoporphyrinogen oxidase
LKYLILGAGPSGLAFANSLLESGETSFLVLEKENEAGGLCRSIKMNETYIDIGGGHILDVRRPDVNSFLFSFMPQEEWNYFNRNSKLFLKNNEINHPIEANIWQMPYNDQIDYLESIAKAGCNMDLPMPEKFTEWIYWKLGVRIAEDYMIPYNQKIFSKDLDELGTYWLEKLPSVSFRETLQSCLEKKAYGLQPGHAQFFYPKKLGYGELWRRMSEKINSNIEYNKKITKLNFQTLEVTGSDGSKYNADKIITTIPWLEFEELSGIPESYVNDVKKLKHNSVYINYYEENLDTDAHWIYYPDKCFPYHRKLINHNLNYNFIGHSTETNSYNEPLIINHGAYEYLNQYAYPLNTLEKPKIMKELLAYAKSKNVIGLGRWGEHQHYNSDVVVDLAIKLAKQLTEY